MTDTKAAPRRRRGKPWIVAVPLILVLMLAACWCGLWFYAASRAEREIDAWIAHEFLLGRAWSCAERSLGGFPFRFEILCREPTLLTRGTGDPLRITAANAHVVAQVWAPNHIVAEFTGPGKVEDTAGGRVFAANWSLLQMSGIGDMSGKPQRLSFSTDKLALQLVTPSAAPTPLFTAKHFETHVRRSASATGGPDGIDFAAGLVDGDNPAITAAGATGPVNLTLQGNVSAVEDLRPMSVAERVRAWAQAGGNLRIDVFQVTTPKAAVSASGAVSVDPQGRLNGAVNLGFAGVEELLKNLAKTGIIAPEMAPLIGAFTLAGKPGDVAGRKGSTFALTLKEGTVQLGKFPMGIIPPLF